MKKSTPVESASARIDERIKALGNRRGKMLVKMRQIIHDADPEIVEAWKWMGTSVCPTGTSSAPEKPKEARQDDLPHGAALKDPSIKLEPPGTGKLRRFRENLP